MIELNFTQTTLLLGLFLGALIGIGVDELVRMAIARNEKHDARRHDD